VDLNCQPLRALYNGIVHEEDMIIFILEKYRKVSTIEIFLDKPGGTIVTRKKLVRKHGLFVFTT